MRIIKEIYMDGDFKMKLTELTDLEAKTIYLIHHKIDYHDTKQLKQICETLQKKKLLNSNAAREYEDYLNRFTADAAVVTATCASCENALGEGELLLCQECLEQLKQRLKVATIEKKAKEKPETIEFSERSEISDSAEISEEQMKRFKIRWPAVVIACVLVLLMAVVCLVMVFHRQSTPEDAKCKESQFVTAYADHLTKQGFYLGDGQPYEQNSTLYPILTREEQKANNSLITFYNENQELEGAALQMNGIDDESRVRQLNLMSFAAVTLYENLTMETAGKLIEQMLNQNGQLDYDGYKWVMTADYTGATFLMIDETLAELPDESSEISEASITVKEDDSELLNLLGSSFDEAEKLLGVSEAVVTDNTRYFQNACVSLIYEKESGNIIYIDCDGSGEQSYTICGIKYGDLKEDVLKILADAGMQKPTSQTEDEVVYSFARDGQNIELSITFLEDKARLICCRQLDK